MQWANAVLGYNLCVNLFLAREDSLAYARDKYLVARLEAELYVLGDSERNDTPVDTVGAVALCGILVADVGVATEHLLAACSLLASRAVAWTVGKYA